MVVRLILGFLGVFHLANGLAMLLAPGRWAAAVVHLAAPDHLHFHFITDIGFAFAGSGVGMLLGAWRGAAKGPWALAGAVWPLLHGLFHLKEWIFDGPPPMPDLLTEGVGVILVGFVGIGLAWVRYRKGEA
ncbi:MAG: hypothetical protein ISS15_12915 [Alphaproteobacteria bacterium]|nr:hypothetical protein [Alphaproteobacteria bacterium]MBL6936397.1 hypothetical protein [Alphaproteobacteria bacterium]MBL7098552.1 hypothetical protein [Alphaproteobacteria bacterium]